MDLKTEHYIEVENSVYNYQKKYTQDYQKENAYRFFKKNISYINSNEQIENIAKMLRKNDKNRTGKVVAVISPMLPEVVSSFYGINKNGSIFFPIDPRTNATRIRDFLNITEATEAFVFDQAYVKIDAIIDQTKLERVTILSVMDSMFPLLGLSFHYDQMKKSKMYEKSIQKTGIDNPEQVKIMIEQLKKKDILTYEDKQILNNLQIYEKMREIALKNIYYTNPPKSGYKSFKDAIKDAEEVEDFDAIYDPQIPASLTLTSGTTGKPKMVPTMNRSYNVKVRDYSYTTMPIEKGDRILSMPPFILYGEVFMHMAYVRGVQNVIIPDITAYYYPNVIRNEKISHAVGVPSQALTLAEDKKFNLHPSKYLKSVSVGGTKMLREHERRINESLTKVNIHVTQGYSMSELTPASSTNMPGFIREGSVGRLIGDTEAIVVNPETLEPLGCNETGILLVHSETQFDGYYKNPDANKSIFIEIDGKIYVNTGDNAYYDEDGYYYIQDRMKEMIIRPDGHNNFPSEMEELLASHPLVKDCAVVGVPYPNYDSPVGEYPKAHIVLREEAKGNETMVEEILRNFCKENLPERDIPYYYQFHDKLPLTPVLKTDKLALRELDKQFYQEKPKLLYK